MKGIVYIFISCVIGTAASQGWFGPHWMRQLLGFDPMQFANIQFPMPNFRVPSNRMVDLNSIAPGSSVDLSDGNTKGTAFRSADGRSGGFSFSSGGGNNGGNQFAMTQRVGGQPGGFQFSFQGQPGRLQQMFFT